MQALECYMYLRDVQLVNSGKHSEEKLEQNQYLMRYWDNVRDQFCLNLPDKLDFLGIAKLNIYLGDFSGPAFEEPDKRGIAIFQRSDFDYSDFVALTEEEKDLISLAYLESSALAVCKEKSAPKKLEDQIKAVAKKVRDSDFQHTKVHKKTSKWNKSRTLRAVTQLCFKKGGVDAYLEIIEKSGNTTSRQKMVESRTWEAVWFDLWKGAWVDDTFVIETRVGDKYFEASSSVVDAI